MNVLIVSKDRGLLRHLSRFLVTFGYQTTQIADYERAARMADSISADLLLVDSEPDFDGALELCRAVSDRNGSGAHYALLMVHGKLRDRLIDAVEAGADDILSKPVVYGEVLMRLRAGARAVEFQRRAHRQRRRDPITGLLSCAAFHARLQAATSSRASRNGKFACAMIEIDFLDRVERQYGRQPEHDLLTEMGGLLERVCDNEHDDLAHFGDGRYGVLLPGTTVAEAVEWGERVRREVAERKFPAGETELDVTVSIGVGGAETLTISPEAVLDKARHALKAAIASGRDCVVQVDQFADEENAWKELAAPGRLFERTVARDVMLPCTVILRATDSIRAAESIFQQTHLTSAAVVNAQDKFVGSIFAEDVAEYLQATGDPEQEISRLMVRDIDVVDEDASFADLMRHFAESDCDLLIVVDQGHPTGLVSAASLTSMSQAPERPAFCTATPSMHSTYLQIAEPLEVGGTVDTI